MGLYSPRSNKHKVPDTSLGVKVRFEREWSLVNHWRSVSILFALNVIDAVVTIMWIRSGLATEGNYIMAGVLDHGVAPFLIVKIAIGVFACGVLLYASEYRLAQVGARIALVAYSFAILAHVLTGFAASGYLS